MEQTPVKSSEMKDDMQRFTATGRPYVPSIEPAGQYCDIIACAPQLLPWKFTDDDLVSIPVPYDSSDLQHESLDKVTSTHWGSKLKNKIAGKKESPQFRIVRVTRGDYLKYFAKDEQGKYCGSEPEGLGLKLLRERDLREKDSQTRPKDAELKH